jgi:hypothetical protein
MDHENGKSIFHDGTKKQNKGSINIDTAVSALY